MALTQEILIWKEFSVSNVHCLPSKALLSQMEEWLYLVVYSQNDYTIMIVCKIQIFLSPLL